MPTSAKGWVKPELRVSIMRVKHLKDTGCHAVEVELDGQRPKRTAWVDGSNDKEFNREAGFFLKGDQQENNADFWNKAFVHVTVILQRTFRSDKNVAVCHLSMKVIRKYGEVRGWVPLMHDSTYAGEMLLRAKLQGVDTWKNCEKGPASEAAFNLPFNGAPDSNTSNWESYNAMMAAAAPMGAPGVFAAMQMRKDTDGKMRAATAEGTPVPMSQEEYNTQVAMLRDIEARHAKETESQRQQWVRQQEEARNRVQELKEEESSSDEEPEEDATDKRKGYPAHMKLDDDDASDDDDGYDDARPSNQVDTMTDSCEGLMGMLYWDADRPGDKGGIVIPPRGQMGDITASRAGPVVPRQPKRASADGGWSTPAGTKADDTWNTADFASLDTAAAQVQSSPGNPFAQQRPITAPPPSPSAQRPVTPTPMQGGVAAYSTAAATSSAMARHAASGTRQHPAQGGYQTVAQTQQQQQANPQQQHRQPRQHQQQPYYVYQGPPPNSVPASFIGGRTQLQPGVVPQRYPSAIPQAPQPQGYPHTGGYNTPYQRPGTAGGQYQQAAAAQHAQSQQPEHPAVAAQRGQYQQQPAVAAQRGQYQQQQPPVAAQRGQYQQQQPAVAAPQGRPAPRTPPSNSVPLGRLGDYSSSAARMASAGGTVYNAPPSPPAVGTSYGRPVQYAAGSPQPQRAPQLPPKPNDPFATLNPFANGGGLS